MISGILALPANFVSTTVSFVGEGISDLSPYATLIIGVIIALLVITTLITVLIHRQ